MIKRSDFRYNSSTSGAMNAESSSPEQAYDVLEVATATGVHHARNVCLAIGRRGSPRKLGVPGQEIRVVDRDRDVEREDAAGHHDYADIEADDVADT